MVLTSRNISVSVIVILLFGACSGVQPDRPTLIPPATNIPILTEPPTVTRRPRPSATQAPPLPTPLPLFNLTSSPIPTPSGTPFEIPFDSLDHPLSIEVMREGDYPGSLISREEILEPGEGYTRYDMYYNSEGWRIYALLTVPDGEKPDDGWPVVIFNHGYIPPGVYRTAERYEEYVDEIARSGYIVFRPDYRGHDRSDGIARGAYGYPDYTIDVLNAVASIKTYPDADPERIGMWGHSMGGYITLRSMVIIPDIKVGVIWAGVVASYPDMVYKWNLPAADTPENFSAWRTSLAATYGTPSQNPAFWDAISANSYLADLSGPIQLHHGTGDSEVPIEFSTTLYRQLQVVQIPAEMYIYENDNHNLSNSFDQAMQRTIRYFDTYLKDNQ